MEGNVEAAGEHYCQSYKHVMKAGMVPNAREVFNSLTALDVDVSKMCGEIDA